MVDWTWRGFTYPMKASNGQLPAASTDVQLIADSIKQILMTRAGSRVMRRDFGSNLLDLVDENVQVFYTQRLTAAIQSAMKKYEPRATFINANIENADSLVTITVQFEYNGDQGFTTLELPKAGA